MTIGIISAMPQEMALLTENIQINQKTTLANRDFLMGVLNGQEVVMAVSHWGKVAAAITASIMIHEFKVDKIIFTGVAGAADTSLNIGDVVIADVLVQHDMNASPLFPQFEIPLLGVDRFQADAVLSKDLLSASQEFFEKELTQEIPQNQLEKFGITKPKIKQGCIVSGDQFVADPKVLADINTGMKNIGIDDLACVEMEGAAVAQVCYEFGVSLAVIRTISDKADHSAPVDFEKFIEKVASHYSSGIMRCFMKSA